MGEIFEQEEADFGTQDIVYMIKQGRGEKTEFFPTLPEDRELSITACSFANNGGGQIVIGVDNGGEIVGINSPTVESTASQILKMEIERKLDLKYTSSNIMINNREVVVLIIKKFEEYPLAADGRFYRRHLKDNIRLAPNEIWELMEQRQNKENNSN